MWSINKNSQPSRLPPYHISLIIRSATSGFFLTLLWEASSAIFEVYVAQAPLKKGDPLTNDSRDPNGSLLNGLKSKKETTRTFAFWELVYIAQRSELRRKEIFTDIDRPGGTAWSQISTLCLGEIQNITTRIKEYQKPSPSATASTPPLQNQPQIQTLPRLSSPLRQDPILTPSPKPTSTRSALESNIGAVAKSYGQSPASQQTSPSLNPKAKEYLVSARNRLLTPDQQKSMSPTGVVSSFNTYLMDFLRSPLGGPFRQTFARRFSAVVLGAPVSELNVIVDATDSLTALGVSSLKEDQFGKVCKDIPILLRNFVAAVQGIEIFKDAMGVHWTDVGFKEDAEGTGRKVADVEIVLDCLRAGIKDLLVGFGDYLVDLGMGRGELSIAREVAGLT